jgi:hypothetical protein
MKSFGEILYDILYAELMDVPEKYFEAVTGDLDMRWEWKDSKGVTKMIFDDVADKFLKEIERG